MYYNWVRDLEYALEEHLFGEIYALSQTPLQGGGIDNAISWAQASEQVKGKFVGSLQLGAQITVTDPPLKKLKQPVATEQMTALEVITFSSDEAEREPRRVNKEDALLKKQEL